MAGAAEAGGGVSLCVFGATTLELAVTAFTLAWTHSVEHVRWEEDWRVTPAGLELVAARVRGSGAGMEPPPEARLVAGWWTWTPEPRPRPEIVLAASGATGAGWSLCADGRCTEIGRAAGPPVRIAPCD